MAVVFLATDLKHDRQVAVKVLRPELSAMLGADRFLREIRVTAQLQHPHILPLHDSGAAGDLLYYVMPLIKGESLRERLDRERQLPVTAAVSITTAIAGALDYAHRQGVLHRDIKPENILLHEGQPMLSDFGIALAVTAAGGRDRLTHTGLSIGTPTYMSPEQVSGDPQLDARTDIYALGSVAYEMLAGTPPFTGPTPQAVAAAVLSRNAEPITAVRHTVPVAVGAAIHRAIERLPADRFSTAAEFATALSTAPQLVHSIVRKSRPWLLPLGMVAGVLLGLFASRFTRREVTASATRRWHIALPQDAPVALAGPTHSSGWQTAIAMSPAGDRIVYVSPRAGSSILMTRALDSDSVTALSGTEGAYLPFFSPDGAWIGFFSGNFLRKVPAAGGNAETLVAVDRIAGADWISADRIMLFEKEGFDLRWISPSGTTADSTLHLGTQFGTPDALPGNQWAVGQLSSGQLALLSLTDGKELAITRRGVLPLDSVRQTDLLFGTSPQWLPSGYLVYASGDGLLMAMPFDAKRREVTGEPVPVIPGVRMEAGFGYAEFALGGDGTMVYVPGGNQLYVHLGFVRPNGSIDTLPFPRGPYTQPRISPDGTRLAAQMRNPVGGWELLIMNLATGVRQKVEVAGNYRAFPASWLPSGKQLMIGIWDPVQFQNYGFRIQSLETGEATELSLPGASYMTISPDGSQFVFSDWRTGDLYLRSLGADTTRTRIQARGFAASFSPNGKWISWGGVNGAVAVSPNPPTGAVYPVAERGQMPLWTPKGDAIIYRDGSRYYQVPVSTAGGFRTGPPRVLVEGSFLSTFAWNHAMGPDGRLLVMPTSSAKSAATLGVITGFPKLVERLRAPR